MTSKISYQLNNRDKRKLVHKESTFSKSGQKNKMLLKQDKSTTQSPFQLIIPSRQQLLHS